VLHLQPCLGLQSSTDIGCPWSCVSTHSAQGGGWSALW
jgi:hypothetical protein